MVSIFFAEKRIIKDNVLAAEITQAENEKSVNLRTIRIGIKKNIGL
jgi:hypothetical protein